MMWVDGTDLNQWANRREAQSTIPQVVRRLILATCGRVERLDFRAGDGVHLSGWDGLAEVDQGNAFAPDGFLAWEFGANKNVKSKADHEYQTRTDNPGDVNPLETTYIFVTPRRWGNKSKWAETKNKEGIWKEVRAYDADDIEAWLETAPPVHVWLSRLIGKIPPNVIDLEAFWNEWSNATSPSLSPSLVLSGRQQISEQITTWLQENAKVLFLKADSSEEALAVLAATVETLPEGVKTAVYSRALIVDNETSWRHLALGKKNFILIPRFSSVSSLQGAIQNENHVFVPLGKDANVSANAIEALNINFKEAVEALESMGLSWDEARDKLRESRRSLPALRRLLATYPETLQPDWSMPDKGHQLVPALLAGEWDEAKEADRKALEEIAQKPYNEIVTPYEQWRNEPDSPLQKVGSLWRIVARTDSWSLASRYITSDDLKAYERVVLSFLGSEDPRYELEPDQRWYASILGKEFLHSQHLRNGLVQTLGLLGGMPASNNTYPSSMPERAGLIVYKLLSETNWIIWSSLSNHLPLLAEAAPETFLDAVEKHLAGDNPQILKLFDEQGVLGTHSPHTGLLWALENLAWNENLLSRVSLILVKLARLDPGGKLANRPIKSLNEIFKLWHPQTTSSVKRRLKVLDTLFQREPDITFQLFLSLVTMNEGFAHPTHKPRWRDWHENLQPTTNYDYSSAAVAIITRIFSHIEDDIDKWLSVLDGVSRFIYHINACETAVTLLEIITVETLGANDQLKLWHKLRDFIHNSKIFRGDDWPIPVKTLDRFELIYNRLEPTNLIDKYGWVFSNQPQLPEIPHSDKFDYKKYSQLLQEVQESVTKEILSQAEWSILLDFAPLIDSPHVLGFQVSKSELCEDSIQKILEATLGTGQNALVNLAHGIVCGTFSVHSWAWVESYTKSESFLNWSLEQRGDFLSFFRPEKRILDIVNNQEQDVQEYYWQNTVAYGVDNELAVEVILNLLNYRRSFDALDITASIEKDEALPDTLLFQILEAVRTSIEAGNAVSDSNMFIYYLDRVFGSLADTHNVDRTRLAKLEWFFLPLFQHSEYSPRMLHDELSTTPAFFAEVVRWMYHSENEEENDLEEVAEHRKQSLAKAGYELMNTWRTIPGTQDDGVMDVEVLLKWVLEARKLCQLSGRGAIGDKHIGQILARSPKDTDGTWPVAAVRNIIDEIESEQLDRGFAMAVYNNRGVTTRSIGEGGQQERNLAETYRGYASSVADTYPRSARVLRQIADSYENEAKRHDLSAELEDY